jgi:uncharacterized protein YndB with AHSA1/START domain
MHDGYSGVEQDLNIHENLTTSIDLACSSDGKRRSDVVCQCIFSFANHQRPCRQMGMAQGFAMLANSGSRGSP